MTSETLVEKCADHTQTTPTTAKSRNPFFAYVAGTKKELDAIASGPLPARIALAAGSCLEAGGIYAFITLQDAYLRNESAQIGYWLTNGDRYDSPMNVKLGIAGICILGNLVCLADLTARISSSVRHVLDTKTPWLWEQPSIIGRMREIYDRASHGRKDGSQAEHPPQTI